MKKPNTRLPEQLDRHLSSAPANETLSTAEYLDRGGSLTVAAAMNALDRLMTEVWAKIRSLAHEPRLQERLEVLAAFYTEAREERRAATTALSESAFALLYFLKGADRIPDSLPEVGLIDDALVAQLVVERHASALRAHWSRQGRRWPSHVESVGI